MWCIALAFGTLPRADAQGAAEARFDLVEFEVLGNTMLPALAIETALLPHMGEGRSIADVEAARLALEKAYADAGYLSVLVDVPEQRIDTGLVQLRVIEGRVERLRVTGARYVDQGWIRDRIPDAAVGRVPDFNALQRQVAAASREDRQIQPLLRPGHAPGTIEVELKVSDRAPWSAGVELNNRHAASTEPLRAQAQLRLGNLWQAEHALSLTAISAPLRSAQSRVVSANYLVPLDRGDEGSQSLLAYATWSDSLLEPLGSATVVGKGHSVGLRWLRSSGSAAAAHSFGAGLELKDFRERISAGDSELSTPLRFVPLALSYSGQWFAAAGRTTRLDMQSSFGLRRLLARRIDCPGTIGPVDAFACRREGADGSFASLRADLRHQQALGERGARGSLALRLAGQWASQPLVSSEQYSIGGAETVRGYLESEGSGDHGLLAGLEWRSTNFARSLGLASPGSAPAPGPSPAALGDLEDLTVLAFAEAARVRILRPGAGQAARIPLAGAGIGLRLRSRERITAEVDIAWPLKATRQTHEADARVHVRLATQF